MLQVASAKIVTSAKTPGSKCFGFVTMASSEEASRCIKHLNKSELHGRIINVDRVRTSDNWTFRYFLLFWLWKLPEFYFLAPTSGILFFGSNFRNFIFWPGILFFGPKNKIPEVFITKKAKNMNHGSPLFPTTFRYISMVYSRWIWKSKTLISLHFVIT